MRNSINKRGSAAFFAILIALAVPGKALRADVFQWTYIDPNDPSQGKKASSTLCPDGLGRTPQPQVSWGFLDLNHAYLAGANLSSSFLNQNNFTDADFAGANLSHVTLLGEASGADFTHANFQSSNLRFCNFDNSDFTDADFSGGGIILGGSFVGANFTRANLSARNISANMTGANFTDANISGATLGVMTAGQMYSTANYKHNDLTFVKSIFHNMDGWDLHGIDFTGAYIETCSLRNADLHGATIKGDWEHNDLTGANLSGATISGSPFFSSGTLNNADLTNANLSDANLVYTAFNRANCMNANFFGAKIGSSDFREAINLNLQGATGSSVILPNGTVSDFGNDTLVVRNFNGDHVSPIHIPAGGELYGYVDIILDHSPWQSVIDFIDAQEVALNGISINLEFADFANDHGPIGATYRLFDWSHARPNSPFANISTHYAWDYSRLYTDGTITLEHFHFKCSV